MELRAITSIDELSKLVSASTFDEFYHKIVEENQRHDEEYYEAYHNMVVSHMHGTIRKIMYGNWAVFGRIMRLWHLARGAKLPKEFYQKRPFLEGYEKCKYQFITDGTSDMRPFFDVAKDIYDNIEQYKATYELLEDEESKNVLIGILVSRLTGDYSHLANLESRNSQYFDSDIIKAYSNEVVVDAGGFTGDTVEALLKTTAAKGKINRIYLYEPSMSNIELAKAVLNKSDTEIIFHQLGVSDRRGSFFITDDGGAGRITDHEQETGKVKVDVVTLDEHIDEKITLVKMDIEGSEKAALQGCKRHILKDAPKLAICVYHKLNDVWWVPQYVKGLNPKYKFYLRFYYQAPMGDMVIYGLPC